MLKHCSSSLDLRGGGESRQLDSRGHRQRQDVAGRDGSGQKTESSPYSQLQSRLSVSLLFIDQEAGRGQGDGGGPTPQPVRVHCNCLGAELTYRTVLVGRASTARQLVTTLLGRSRHAHHTDPAIFQLRLEVRQYSTAPPTTIPLADSDLVLHILQCNPWPAVDTQATQSALAT